MLTCCDGEIKFYEEVVSADDLTLFLRTLEHVNLNQFLIGRFRCLNVLMCLFVYLCDLYMLRTVYLYFAFLLAACKRLNLPFV